jgi:hypothetical protein
MSAAIILPLSFLSTAVQVGVESSTSLTGVMACCVGEPGHPTETCRSGLSNLNVKKELDPVVEGEVLCGLRESVVALPVVGDTSNPEESDHCAFSQTTVAESKQSQPPASFHAPIIPCSAECGACSTAYTRRPRPREEADLPHPLRSPPASLATQRGGYLLQIKTVNLKWSHLRPRAPPSVYA